ncbi:MAG: MarR family transcriptional regulator [Rhodobacteraceae bacterium]|nr:MarR family transcriptional regulator [Paracoccaceae bacterium]
MSAPSDFDLRQFLPYLLNQAAEASSLNFQNIYKNRYGMLRTEWRVLFHLGIYGEMTARDIGTMAKIHKTKISRAVQRLEDRRYLVKKRDEEDRRIDRLALTKAGITVYKDLYAIAQTYDDQLTSRLDADEIKVLRRALLKLTK